MKLKTINGKEYIFDVVRKKYVLNQPEEWVRQHIIKYLNEKKNYPISLMSVEKQININKTIKRYDLVCYNTDGKPLFLVECKAPNIKLNIETFDQSFNYQNEVKAKYIMVTNGTTHFCFEIKNEKPIFLKEIPHYTTK